MDLKQNKYMHQTGRANAFCSGVSSPKEGTEHFNVVWKSTFQFFCNKKICPCAYVRPGPASGSKITTTNSIDENDQGNVKKSEGRLIFVDDLLEKTLNPENEIKVSMPGCGVLFKVPMISSVDQAIMYNPKTTELPSSNQGKDDVHGAESEKTGISISVNGNGKSKKALSSRPKAISQSQIGENRESQKDSKAKTRQPKPTPFPQKRSRPDFPFPKPGLNEITYEIQHENKTEIREKQKEEKNAPIVEMKDSGNISRSEKARSRLESMRKIREKKAAWTLRTSTGESKSKLRKQSKEKTTKAHKNSWSDGNIQKATASSRNHIEAINPGNESSPMHDNDLDYEDLILREMLQEVILDFPLLSPPSSPEPEAGLNLALHEPKIHERQMTPTGIITMEQVEENLEILNCNFLTEAGHGFQKSWNFNALGPYSHLANLSEVTVKSPALFENPFDLPLPAHDLMDLRYRTGYNEFKANNMHFRENMERKPVCKQNGEIKVEKFNPKPIQKGLENFSRNKCKNATELAKCKGSNRVRNSKGRALSNAEPFVANTNTVMSSKHIKLWMTDRDHRILPPTKRKIHEDLNKVFVLGRDRCETKALLLKTKEHDKTNGANWTDRGDPSKNCKCKNY